MAKVLVGVRFSVLVRVRVGGRVIDYIAVTVSSIIRVLRKFASFRYFNV